MAIVRCANGHYFDEAKYNSCPICGDAISSVFTKKQIIISTEGDSGKPQQMTQRFSEDSATNEDVTISLDMSKGKNALTTGWLVCIKGNSKGKSFPIRTGRCFIGRDYGMDIVIPDREVSRINHASVVYDKKDNKFYFVHGTNPVMVNGEFIKDSIPLKEDDVLTIGNGEYVFIPFCKEGRNWNED